MEMVSFFYEQFVLDSPTHLDVFLSIVMKVLICHVGMIYAPFSELLLKWWHLHSFEIARKIEIL
jgi:hypothetical protein